MNRSVAVFCALLAGAPALGRQYQWGWLSENEAIGVVRAFEGEPSLQVQVIRGAVMPPSGPSTEVQYRLSAGDYEYWVCACSPGWFHRVNRKRSLDPDGYYGQPYDPAALSQRVMTQATAQAIASDFVQAHFPQPSLLTQPPTVVQRTIDVPFMESYDFTFTQRQANGALGPSKCRVSVDSVTGEVRQFFFGWFPTLVAGDPGLSAEQAAAAAAASIPINDAVLEQVRGLGIPYPDPFGYETYAYGLVIDGVCPAVSQHRESYDLIVDAYTGAVYACGPLLGSLKAGRHGRPLPAPASAPRPLKVVMGGRPVHAAIAPLLLADRPYLYVGYLCYGNAGARKAYRGPGDIRIAGKGRDLRFSATSTTYKANGTSRSLPARPVVLHGRTYVPIEAARGVLPFDVRYDAAGKTVRFDPMRESKVSGMAPRPSPASVERRSPGPTSGQRHGTRRQGPRLRQQDGAWGSQDYTGATCSVGWPATTSYDAGDPGGASRKWVQHFYQALMKGRESVGAPLTVLEALSYARDKVNDEYPNNSYNFDQALIFGNGGVTVAPVSQSGG